MSDVRYRPATAAEMVGRVQIMRHIQTPTGLAEMIVPIAADRISLWIVGLTADTVWVSPDPKVTVEGGIPLNETTAPLRLGVKDDPGLVAADWYGINVAGAGSLLIIQLIAR